MTAPVVHSHRNQILHFKSLLEIKIVGKIFVVHNIGKDLVI